MAKERREKTGKGCLIYSIGSNGNFMFEEGMVNLLGKGVCEVHVFDFTDYSRSVPKSIRNMVHFHAWGLKSSSASSEAVLGETATKFIQKVIAQPSKISYSLQETVELLGHQGRIIDIFKIDCEGCEWETYNDWLTADVDIRQILVEVHHVRSEAIDFFLSLQNAGFVTFHKEPNIEWAGGRCVEYCFLKLGNDFFL